MAVVADPFRTAAEITALRDLPQTGAIRVNDVDVGQLKALPAAVAERERVAAAGGEGDPLSVGRPGRAEISSGARCQRACAARGQVESPQNGMAAIARRDKNELLAIRRK